MQLKTEINNQYNEDYFLGLTSNYERGYIPKDRIFKRYLSWIEPYLHNTNCKILDIGCAYGYFLHLCDKKGFKTYGVDLSTLAVNKAKRNTHAKLFIGDLNKKLPFNDNFFNIITMFDVIEHLKSPYEGVKEIYRILKKGGYIIVTTANLNAIDRLFNKRNWHGFKDKTHLYLFTPTSLKFLFQRVGFKVLDIKTPFHLFPYIVQKIINNSGLGGQIWLVAEKC